MSSIAPLPYKKILVLCLWLASWIFVGLDTPIRALWPSILALISVLLLRKVITGLLIGGSAGTILLSNGNPFAAFTAFFTEHLIPALQSSWNISVLIFTLLLGGFVALIEKGGGIQSLVQRWLKKPDALKARVQWSAFGLGIVCFFDGLANSLLVGKSLTPVAKQAGVSKEKLSYIVDSTSAAVACVAVISTWIAYQLSMIQQGYEAVGITDVNAFGLFFRSIPLNYYCWFTLALLAIVIARNWNLGPMRTAEIESRASAAEMTDTSENSTGVWRAIVPLVVLIGGLIGGLYMDGIEGGFFPLSLTRIATAFGAADAAKLLVTVSALGCIIAYLSNFTALKDEDPGQIFMGGVLHLFNPCLILISVWILSSTIKELGAAEVLSHLLEGNLPVGLFPATVFVVGTLISFTTGSSWGTMGVLMPLALPVAINLAGGSGELTSALIPGTIAAVFSGAVFGDHCSPLSDTTIVASIACDIEPLEHVRSQLPYALIAAAVALLIGFIPSGFGLPSWVSLPIGFALLLSLPRLFKAS